MIGAEQSNTSVVFGDAAMFKVFRRVTPGVNPDIELNRELARAGNPHVARLLGSFETTLRRRVVLAGHGHRVRRQLRRGLGHGHRQHARPGRRPATDFAGESYRLGEAVASVHQTLAAALGTSGEPFPVDAAPRSG